jgi:hypothetical protein
MSSFNLSNNHPIIPNANQYFYEKKYISISSTDRDLLKYPNSSEFEIELPQDYLNVASARLYSWSFPANYSVFSVFNFNLSMTFKFNTLYNPGEFGISDVLTEGIFAALYANLDKEYIITIEPGFYNPNQMATELTNKFNEIVTATIIIFFENNPAYNAAKTLFSTYNRFTIVYNTVSQNLWFGNNADQFTLTNDSLQYYENIITNSTCFRKGVLPETANWGLPAYLGFTRCDATALNTQEILANEFNQHNFPYITDFSIYKIQNVPRFYYGDAIIDSGDNGYWLLPNLPKATVYFLQAPFKINFMGPAYIYMEIDGMNCIDETSPYNISSFTAHTNETNGIVNSCFAKIPVPTTPISQWFDNDMGPYKYYNPPAERIRKLKIKFRYHNGQNVDFGTFDYSIMLEFNLLKNQQERSYSVRDAFNLSQIQSFGK